jgi:phenylacetate-coenzyme A ligase PaaK-like adenylate-forming protein
MDMEKLPVSAESGDLLDRLTNTSGDEILGIRHPVESLDEQKEIAQDHLDEYLRNLSDTKGAVKIIEQFYREEHNREIDASDHSELKEEIPDIDSVIHKNALPMLSKESIRERYCVAGSAHAVTEDSNNSNEVFLTPDRIIEATDEPKFVSTTSGTTGEPWTRSMTRNDVVLPMLSIARFAKCVLEYLDTEPEKVNTANVFPVSTTRDYISETLDKIGFNVKTFDYEEASSGGKSERKKTNQIIRHLNSGEYSFVIFPIQLMLEGYMGVKIRRGETNIDATLNAGAPFSETQRQTVEREGTHIFDVYGETEYPEYAMKKTVDGVTGFDLPFNSQINLIYDSDSDELKYEGQGRFAYLPFGIEGQAIPGVYMSGIKCVMEKVGNKHQIISDIERVGDYEGCSAPS